MPAALTHLIPIQELAPGAVAAIRNQIINSLVAQASRELNLPPEKLVVRDVRPREDLGLYGASTTDATTELWGWTTTATSVGFTSWSGDNVMGDQRYVALFGVRDRGLYYGASGSATLAVALTSYKTVVSLIKINVGGADKVTWDISSLRAYRDAQVGFAPTAVVIPQNTTFNISPYKSGSIEVGIMTSAITQEIMWLELVGITVEPRGKTISP